MTTTLLATYANGVFKPDAAVDLPENAKVELTVTPVNGAAKLGATEALEAFLRMCRETPLHSGVGWQGRDELYDRD
jgi:predicted DNA-binding antitoxin AbrB/MazE fold protein